MREIKFRGKRMDNGKWVFGNLFAGHDGTCQISYNEMNFTQTWKQKSVNPKTVGQFTGLKDKNGTEIFEGDIIKDSEISYTVKYGEYDDSMLDDKAFGWYTENTEDDVYNTMHFVLYANTNQVEVIGNIHDLIES